MKHRKFCLNIRKHFLTVRVIMAQIAQEDCGSCRYPKIFGYQKTSGHDCDLLLGVLARAVWLDIMISRDAFQTQLFCDPVSIFIGHFFKCNAAVVWIWRSVPWAPFYFFSPKLPRMFFLKKTNWIEVICNGQV